MGSAFWTSLSAICCSLIIRLTTMFMEAMFKSRVLKSIVSADPQLIQYIERRAFLENKPGALLRPHSLREVLWQQNIQFTKQLERLGREISSAIRELPFASPLSAPISRPTSASLSRTSSGQSGLGVDASATKSRQVETASLSSAEPTGDISTRQFDADQGTAILAEMRKQTALLEQLVFMQKQAQSARRLELATQTQMTAPRDLT